MHRFLDLDGLKHFLEKIRIWVNRHFQEKGDYAYKAQLNQKQDSMQEVSNFEIKRIVDGEI